MRRARFYGRRTKIVCTIGPATGSTTAIEQLIRAGMNVARFNLSHGTYKEHARYIQAVRKSSQRLGVNVAILIDIPGPKYRTGKLHASRAKLKKGALLALTTRQLEGNSTVVSVNSPSLPQDVKIGDTILLDDGALQLKVLNKEATEIECRVVVGGLLTERRGLVVPGMYTSAPFVTDLLQENVLFANKQHPDYLALSFVRTAEDIIKTKELLQRKSCDIPVIAKIERRQAVVNFDKILEASDGIMVARGDLGVDIPLQRVPIVQKQIIKKCNRAGKPVITATQMLESMISSARPTRAEVTDVANAIFDGSDAIMLSAETSVGKYPAEAVRIMTRIARETEGQLPHENMLIERNNWLQSQTDELISYNACHTASRLGAAAIVAFTESGSTAWRVSKYRPRMPVLAITTSKDVVGKLQLCWGIQSLWIDRPSSVRELFTTAARLCKDMGLAKAGDLIVITGGIPIGVTGSTNLLKVETIS